MNKTITIILALLMLGFSHLSAQNVGIGTATPQAKLHVNQTADVDGILVDQTGAAGNSLELVPTNTGNLSSTIWIQNGSGGSGINNQMLNAASTASAMISTNLGLGLGLEIEQFNTGTASSAIQIDQDGTGAFSRGVDMYLDTANIAIGYTLFHEGTGTGLFMNLSNASNASPGYDLRHAGTGRGVYVDLTNAASTATGSALYHAGTGRGSEVGLLNTTTTEMVSLLFNNGLGRGQEISLGNSSNQEMGLGIFHSGDGTGQYITISDPNATRNSLGLLISYNATGGGAAGGGNALEVQHNGTNGNGVDVFVGDPTVAAGPTNTTSEYVAMSISHMATGTSPSPGRIKAAITASSNSADPTIVVNNLGIEDGGGMQVFVTPVLTANQATAIYAQSADATGGEGIGIVGFGGDYGVIGNTNGGNNIGIFSSTDFAANGTKAFLIDHPLDPANKTLRHFCIESNEVLNMYRGIVQLDANGQAVIELPNYFDAINVNPSYQLTAIGTAVQPYIATEIANNQFTITGAPNTKVSWTVHAQRNDPTLQYYSSKIPEYTSNVRMKRPHEIGKYYNPKAYGKTEAEGILYNANSAKNYKEREIFVKEQKSMSEENLKRTSLKKEQKGNIPAIGIPSSRGSRTTESITKR